MLSAIVFVVTLRAIARFGRGVAYDEAKSNGIAPAERERSVSLE